MKKMEEKKVAYSVTKFCDNDNYRYKGIGKLIGTNLHMFGNKVLEDITKYCQPIPYKTNEFKGYYDEINEIEVETKFGNYQTVEIQTEYKVWYKII